MLYFANLMKIAKTGGNSEITNDVIRPYKITDRSIPQGVQSKLHKTASMKKFINILISCFM